MVTIVAALQAVMILDFMRRNSPGKLDAPGALMGALLLAFTNVVLGVF